MDARYVYHVALSFAGEERRYAAALAELLIGRGLSVFYDEYERASMWGKDMADYFHRTYTKDSLYCIPLISEHYVSKVWPRFEIKAAISEAISRRHEYVLPLRVDDTPAPGLLSSINYVDLRTTSIPDVAELVCTKINLWEGLHGMAVSSTHPIRGTEERLLVQSAKVSPKGIRVGVVCPLTGSTSAFGQSVKQGVQLLAQRFNLAGGVKGRQVLLLLRDDENNPSRTVRAVMDLIRNEQVVSIIGSVASRCTIPAAQIAQSYRVPLITPTSTHEKVTQVGDFVFRACVVDRVQGSAMAVFARHDLRAATAACLFDNSNDYCIRLAESFRDTFTQRGGTMTRFLTYPTGTVDFQPLLGEVKRGQPDVLFLPDYYSVAGLIARQARDMDLRATLLGGDGWDSSSLIEIGGQAVEGSYFSNHYSPNAVPDALPFVDAYIQAYGQVPDALAGLSYEAALLLFSAIEAAVDLTGTSIRDALSSVRVRGLMGPLRINPRTGNPEKPLAVIRVAGGRQLSQGVVNPFAE